ncbi:MAG: HDOD domain-containing protein [Thermosulfidibacteraceae bacterium]|jgi:putative nucleotidyltransferase with HDIG domain
MNREKLLEDVKKLNKLPALPEVVYKIMLLKEEDCSLSALEGVISKDPVITAKLLKIANTVYFNPYGQSVTGLKRAIELIGVRNIFSVVLSIVVTNLFPIEAKTFYRELFWKHSFLCAFISKRLSRFVKGVSDDTAFTTGLLHDIGKLVFYSYFGDSYEKVVELTQKGIPSYLAEMRVFGVSHDEVGSVLLEVWGLPAEVVEAVRFHHTLTDSRNFSELTALVHVSNILTMLSSFSYNSGVLFVVLNDDPGWLRLKDYITDSDYEIHKIFDDVVYAIDIAEIAWSRE